ncbi:MAG: hypothetical protein KKF30_10155 [Proteobacteria bacterium]|nr:hypothetical protein [Pseudomonadota bacterium]MBU4468904.1 hypothetical protein [Pseudomonadota bacterium]MCG2750897.1 hypothetical protein [Desulfobacteraceae bacterium]
MSITGTYILSLQTPMGTQTPTLKLKEDGGKVSGSMAGPMGSNEFDNGTANGNAVTWEMKISAMGQNIALSCNALVDGDAISGKMTSPMGALDFTGKREG